MKESLLKHKTVGGGGGEYLDCVRNLYERNRRSAYNVVITAVVKVDKVICYSTFCDDQFICLTCISIFVISEVFEDSSLAGVGFFHLRITTIPISS